LGQKRTLKGEIQSALVRKIDTKNEFGDKFNLFIELRANF